jgi:hypothetical protein
MGADEGAHLGERRAACGELRVEEMPGMDHLGPDPQCGVHLRGAGDGCEPQGIVEEGFRGADLDEQRRQAAQIGMQRRDQRQAGIGTREIKGREFLKIGFLDQGIEGRLGGHAAAGHREIRPGRAAPAAGGER